VIQPKPRAFSRLKTADPGCVQRRRELWKEGTRSAVIGSRCECPWQRRRPSRRFGTLREPHRLQLDRLQKQCQQRQRKGGGYFGDLESTLLTRPQRFEWHAHQIGKKTKSTIYTIIVDIFPHSNQCAIVCSGIPSRIVESMDTKSHPVLSG
jgi:hypothetical protein